jgi:predicted DNA-binding transcriptional regulator AlpA
MKLLDHADLRERKGIKYSARHLRTLVAEHKFPVPFAMGAKLVWLESEIDEWIAALPRARAVPAVRVEPPVAEPAPISAIVAIPRHRISRPRRVSRTAAEAERARWLGVLSVMA